MDLKKRFSDIPDNLDVANIGSGPSFYDFDWSAVPEISGFNMAVAPEDFRYDARIIKHYGSHIKRGGVVIVVVVAPLSFGRNDYLYKDSFSEKYVSILPAPDVDIPKWKYSLYKKFPITLKSKNLVSKVVKGVQRRTKRVLNRKNFHSQDPMEGLFESWISNNQYLTDLKNAGQAEYYQDVFREKENDLKKVIDNCIEQGLKPAIVIPPMSKRLRKHISDEFIERFVYDNLRTIVKEGMPFLDYIDDERYYDDSFYTNGLFLTPEKRKYFTQNVWKDISKIV